MQLLSNLGINASRKQDTFFIDPGLIVMWFGQSNEIPEGWALCDGSGGRPDLRDKFIVGAGDTYAIGNTGGFADTVLIGHTHTGSTGISSGANHSHTFHKAAQSGSKGFRSSNNLQSSSSTGGGGGHTHTGTLSISNTGVSATGRNIPPYRALFYIIREAT